MDMKNWVVIFGVYKYNKNIFFVYRHREEESI